MVASIAPWNYPVAGLYRSTLPALLTGNAVVVKPGTGLWQTMSGLGKVQRRYADPVGGQAGYFGTITEADGGTAIVATIVSLISSTF